MEIRAEFKELLALFNTHKVDYIIVGGYALAFYGAPRFTGDLDIWVNPTTANASLVMAALADFGFGDIGLTAVDFEMPGKTIQLGRPPIRIDLVTSISGVSWEQAYRGRLPGDYGGLPVCFLGKTEFIANKAATGRPKDWADIAALEKKDKET